MSSAIGSYMGTYSGRHECMSMYFLFRWVHVIVLGLLISYLMFWLESKNNIERKKLHLHFEAN